ncbi:MULTISPECIES: universal stress protein [Glutamicibacter]|uniref:universal stress protein n=1 Tax=Glutamicibacter TaxID=1742989 RepID=UPI000EF8FE01|nr:MULTISPECIES: universal stress protein [Glutamicibacter]QEP08217.1 universal stress protein [Glutamicibacter sp. ZJUTW]RWZ85057.1 universal stress protein [Glutamicibacter sp. HZAU]UTM46222.1 universal stress protein [Glutamicibacter mysorens]
MSIIVGYVPTPVGQAAVDAAIREAKLREEPLLIVNSSREGSLVDKHTASPEDLARVLAAATAAGIEAQIVESSYRDDLTEEFLGLAEKHEVSLIVIGLRQRSQVGKFIMGSHAQRILLQAQHPVLAVKAG